MKSNSQPTKSPLQQLDDLRPQLIESTRRLKERNDKLEGKITDSQRALLASKGQES